MITPSFSLTATERVLPKLALDFTTASLDPRITFTRALNTATVINSSGSIVGINANLPRFDYDPVTLVCKGLLIEESRINILQYSEDFTGASWTSQGTTAQTATTVTDNDAALAANRYQQFTIANDGTTYVASWYVAKNQSQIVALQFQVFNGTAINYGIALDTTTGLYNQAATIASDPGANATVTNAGSNGWRVTIKLTNNSTGNTTARVRFYPAYATVLGASNTSADVTLTGTATCSKMQLEAGAFATSYIPNLATGTTTRNADVATMTGTNFSSWYNQSEGALQIKTNVISSAVIGSVAGTVFQDNSNYIGFSFVAGYTPRALVRNAGTFVVNSSSTAQTNPFNQVIAYKATSISFASNATLIGNSINATQPTSMTSLQIGYNGQSGAYANAWITKINYWPQRLINNEAIAFSK